MGIKRNLIISRKLFNPGCLKKIIGSSFLFIAAIVIFPSCSESPEKVKTKIKLDSLIYDGNGKLFTGIKKGDLKGKKIEYEVVNGIKNGFFKLYGVKGKLEMEGIIKENKNEGLWRYYYPDGTIESEGNFINDTLHGKWNWFYPSGKLKETANYNNGLRDGKIVFYNEEEVIISEKLFEKGVEIKNE